MINYLCRCAAKGTANNVKMFPTTPMKETTKPQIPRAILQDLFSSSGRQRFSIDLSHPLQRSKSKEPLTQRVLRMAICVLFRISHVKLDI